MGTAHYKGSDNSWKNRHHFVKHMNSYNEKTACFREELGGSGSVRCSSEFEFKVFECDGCACKNTKGQLDLIKFDAVHIQSMQTSQPACKPWFLYVDLMIRNQLANLRKTALVNKVGKCQLK